ncbi:MAG TPA: hypothetical protein VNL35_07795 [Chloroflexota bacterium]|nr:hypothetical protein [Chloroflexota bacterium]
MHTTSRPLIRRPRPLLSWFHALRKERRERRRRATIEVNLRRIDTGAFPMLSDVAHPPNHSPSSEDQT